jgi:DNA repair protein RadC
MGLFTPKELMMMTTRQETQRLLFAELLVKSGILPEKVASNFDLQDLREGIDVEGYMAFYSLTLRQAEKVHAFAALAKMLWANSSLEDRPVIDRPETVGKILLGDLGFALQEKFAVLLLDVKNRLIMYRIMSLGTLDQTIAHPRDIFRDAIKANAGGIILAHNHPTGSTDPSSEDLSLTKQLLECGRLVQIPVLDHVIVGGFTGNFTSIRRTTGLWNL